MKLLSLLGMTLTFLGGWGAGHPVQAAVIAVTTTSDEFGSGPDCSLREALEAANTNKAFGGCSAGEAAPVIDTVNVGPGTYLLSLTSGIGNQGGDLNTTESVTVVGEPANPASTTIDAAATSDRVFMLGAEGNGTITLRGLSITGGNAPTGGGIENHAANLIVEYSIIHHNSADWGGGGIHSADENAMLILRNSLLLSNHATGTSSTKGFGGGLVIENGTAKIINTTISENTATQHGGGIRNTSGSLTLVNVTLTQNTANSDNATPAGGEAGSGGGIYAPFDTPLEVRNSLIAFNHTAATADTQNCFFIEQTSPSFGYNLENSNTCKFTATGDLANNANLLLSAAADYNGGPTPTHKINPGSDAVDHVADGACTDLTGAPLVIDQRGSLRPVDGDAVAGARCDSGAFELEACGDGVVAGQEVCDPGAPGVNDCCRNDCRSFEAAGTSCQNVAGAAGSCDGAGACSVCGDGVVGGNEDCDVGPDVAADCCESNCSFKPETSVCDDGNGDTTGDLCNSGGVCSGIPIVPPVPETSPEASTPPTVPPALPSGVPASPSAPQAGGDADGAGVGGGAAAIGLQGAGCSLVLTTPMTCLPTSIWFLVFGLVTGAVWLRLR